MKKLIRVGLILALLGLVAGGIFTLVAWRATQQVPQFYVEALVPEPARQREAADELEREVLDLHNEVRRPGRWEARFSQDHINGWLATDLPEKFPGALPKGVSEPRVAIEPDLVQLAVRFQQGEVSTVLSAAGDAYLTERPNEVAIHLHYVRAGAIPVPLGQFLDQIARGATEAGLPLRWSESDGQPVAIIALPLSREEFRGQNLQVERLEVREGEIVISGRTEPESPRTADKPADKPNDDRQSRVNSPAKSTDQR
ncbi:MAG: hypothetical protein SFU86_20225 [Pirellulaceae bacterium]|nr:hypothetical protein [Pirellulaceae bacterium]